MIASPAVPSLLLRWYRQPSDSEADAERAAIEEGLKQKATEFNEAGAEIYAKT